MQDWRLIQGRKVYIASSIAILVATANAGMVIKDARIHKMACVKTVAPIHIRKDLYLRHLLYAKFVRRLLLMIRRGNKVARNTVFTIVTPVNSAMERIASRIK
jgi:hypothetical protein